MKNIFITVAIAGGVIACNNTEQKGETNNDSTILAPETNSNMTDTHPIVTDSSKVDPGHLQPDTLMTNK
ncbi:MAG: hypothetical protein ABIN97_15860 [Ginsengibacter sp.]